MQRKYNRAYDLLLLLGIMAVLCCITRLWPLVLLILVGVIVAALMLLCRAGEPAREQPQPTVPQRAPERPEPTEQELLRMAYGIIQRRITAELVSEFPEVRWVWESAASMQDIREDGVYAILLNHAGGHRRAWAHIHGLRLIKVSLGDQPAPDAGPEPEAPPAPDLDAPMDAEWEPIEDEDAPPSGVNYDLLAFGWVEDNMTMLIDMCNEAIAAHTDSLLIPVSALPDREAWDAVCCQLEQHDFPAAHCAEDGIQVTIPQTKKAGDGNEHQSDDPICI